MRLHTLLVMTFLPVCCSPHTALPYDGGDTYVFAASACPSWKTKLLEHYAEHVGDACANDVKSFTGSVKKALRVPESNITVLLNEQATYDGLTKGLADFAASVPPGARAILYFNFHGDISDIDRNDKTGNNEVFVLWTEEKPFTMLSALALEQWISAKELRSFIDSVRADEVIVVVDACHAGETVPAILNSSGRGADWQGSEAVMMSSAAGQYSYFTIDGSRGLFTSSLSESMLSSANLGEAFDNAAEEVSAYMAREDNKRKCGEMIWKTMHVEASCKQTPLAYDPAGLLPAVELMSRETTPVE